MYNARARHDDCFTDLVSASKSGLIYSNTLILVKAHISYLIEMWAAFTSINNSGGLVSPR